MRRRQFLGSALAATVTPACFARAGAGEVLLRGAKVGKIVIRVS